MSVVSQTLYTVNVHRDCFEHSLAKKRSNKRKRNEKNDDDFIFELTTINLSAFKKGVVFFLIPCAVATCFIFINFLIKLIMLEVLDP